VSWTLYVWFCSTKATAGLAAIFRAVVTSADTSKPRKAERNVRATVPPCLPVTSVAAPGTAAGPTAESLKTTR
jgi:hypothetical protein